MATTHGDILHAAAHLAANRAAGRLGVHSRYVADHDVLGGAVVLVAEAVPAALDATLATATVTLVTVISFWLARESSSYLDCDHVVTAVVPD